MAKNEYDLIVIGGGAAGNGAAFNAKKLRKRVALVERDLVGGTCTNYGCDPSKALLHTAKLLHESKQFEKYGLEAHGVKLNWSLAQAQLKALIQEMRGGSEEEINQTYEEAGIDLIREHGEFVDAHRVRVGERIISAEKIIITTGSKPLIPKIEGLESADYLTNRDAFYLETLPKSMIILGSGPVGTEFAQMFSRFGVAVTLVEATDRILPNDERDLVEGLASILTDEGIKIRLNAKAVAVKQANGTTVILEGGEEISAEKLLVAVGRAPATDGLNLAAAGIETDADGWIRTDATLRTSQSHIFAAGDVSGGYQFTHVANQQGDCLAHNAFSDSLQTFNRDPIPWVTYCSPQLAHVGQTSAQLEEADIEFATVMLPIGDIARAQLLKKEDGCIKLLSDPDGKILGGHILAENAGELIGTLVLAMRFNATLEDLATLTLPYPSWVEGIKWAADKGYKA